MKEEDIISNNKLIAEFMNIDLPFSVSDFAIIIFRLNGYYHKSWDWLMPVVEKIESLGYFCMINKWTSVYTGEEKPGGRIEITTVQGFSKINNTYLAVLAFINWYNSNKKSWQQQQKQSKN